MGLQMVENMGGWVGFSIRGLHTPVAFLDKYPPLVFELLICGIKRPRLESCKNAYPSNDGLDGSLKFKA